MATQQQMTKDNQDFGDAYNEELPKQAAQTDDDAFGLTIPAPSEEDEYPQSPEDAIEAEPGEYTEMASPSEHELKLKAWEHQLMMREQALNGKQGGEQELNGEREELSAEEAGESGSEESGEQALKTLADDFGDDFARLISLVIDAKIGKSQASLSQSVDEIINDIVDTKTRNHFEAIAAKHPDFTDIDKSPEFAKYLASMPPEATQVAQSGSAREICDLLDAYKASMGNAKPKVKPPNIDAAEGVRSSGIRLPTQPGANGDYAAAWDEFSD